MHPSSFVIVAEGEAHPRREFILSREASEWLMASRFWDRFNRVHGTGFGHYEEDLLPAGLVQQLRAALDVELQRVEETAQPVLRFRYGWNEKKQELYCSVGGEELREELEALRGFVREAERLQAGVHCRL